MIGSDWPVSTAAGDYSRTMRVVVDYLASHPAADQEAILGGNAQRFWRLKVDEDQGVRARRAAAAVRGV
jgi:L-fuconolactonase